MYFCAHNTIRMRIYLIGYMGSGKSSNGKKLASRLGYSFLDLDVQIEEEHNQSVSDIFADKGESVFRDIERCALHKTLDIDQLVISTGGGTPVFFDNMKWMKKHGLCVYLKASPEVLSNRLKHNQQLRPLIASLNEDELLQFITKQLEQRSPIYEQANLHLEAKDLTPSILEKQIQFWLDNHAEY